MPKISNLPPVGGVNAVDTLPLVQAGTTAKATFAQLPISTAVQTALDAKANAASIGTIASQNANNVTITGGTITNITDLAIADGGTGASTASQARTNLEAYGSAGGPVSGRVYTPPNIQAFSATPTFDASLSNVFHLGAMSAAVTSVTINNPVDGQTIAIRFVQNGTGLNNITLPATIKAQGSYSLSASVASWLIITYVLSAARWEGYWLVVPA